MLDITNQWEADSRYPQTLLAAHGSRLAIFSAADPAQDRKPIFLLSQEETDELIEFLMEEDLAHLRLRPMTSERLAIYRPGDGQVYLRVNTRDERGVYSQDSLLAALDAIQDAQLVSC